MKHLGGAQGFSYKTCHVADRERVCNVREPGMSYLSEFSLSRRFVRQSSTNLQAVQTAQNITQENIASIYHQAIFILAHYFSQGPTFLTCYLQ